MIVAAGILAAIGVAEGGIRSELFASGFTGPVFVTAPPGDERLFVVEIAGTIRIVEAGVVLPTPFLDITFEVSDSGAWGMFGLEFDPQYASNGLFYVYYIDPTGELRVSRFSVSANPNNSGLSQSLLLVTSMNLAFRSPSA